MDNNAAKQQEQETIKIKDWNDFNYAERYDVEFLCKMRDAYEQQVENYEQNSTYEKIMKELWKQEKVITKLAEAQEKEDRNQKIVNNLLENNDVYFIQEQERYYEWIEESFRWSISTITSFRTAFGLLGRELYSKFLQKLSEEGRMQKSAEYTFKADKNTLNLLKMDHWLKPVEAEEINPWFDILLDALGKGDQDIKDHIEQLIWFKYKHPDDYKIPCLIIYGEGGLGKNELFVEGILTSIYGDHQVNIVDYSRIGGQFNDSVEGQVVVFIDEATANKTDASVLKSLVGNKTVNINAKHKTPRKCRNTPWYISGGNDRTGVLLLDGTSSDRRWSIIKIPKGKDIMYWVMERMGCETREEAIELFFKNDKVYKNREEVAKFLGYLESKWGDIKRPEAFRNADYDELLEYQKDTFTCFCDWLFDDSFVWLSGKSIYQLYETYIMSYGDSYERKNKVLPRGPKFWQPIDEYLEGTDIKKGKIKYKKNGKQTSTSGYFRTNKDIKTLSVDTPEPIGRYVVGDLDDPKWTLAEREEAVEEDEGKVENISGDFTKMFEKDNLI